MTGSYPFSIYHNINKANEGKTMVDNSYLELIDKAAALDAKIKAETMELNQIKEIIRAAIEAGELPVGKTPTKKHVLTVSASDILPPLSLINSA